MKVFICLDDSGGMMFNRRRQSRDSAVIDDIVRSTADGTLYIRPYSEPLLGNSGGKYTVSENALTDARAEDFCFIEDAHLSDHIDRIDELTVYRWNRKYPTDFSLDIDISGSGFEQVSTCDFAGFSHEKITKEIYRK